MVQSHVNKNVTRNVAKLFSQLLEKLYPKSNKHKIVNRNTVKVSYSCMENISQIIKSHNKKVISKTKTLLHTAFAEPITNVYGKKKIWQKDNYVKGNCLHWL